MRRKYHIKTHMLVILIGLTCSMLAAVAVTFNLSVYGLIRSRVSAQLETVLESASEERRGEHHGENMGGRFGSHPNRVMGSLSNAIILTADGSPVNDYREFDTAAGELSQWIKENFDSQELTNKVVSLESGVFAITLTEDPADEDQLLLIYVDVTATTELTKLVNTVLFGIILTAILLSVILSSRFAGDFAKSVRSLSEFAEDIGGGSLEPRELHFRDIEFDDLAVSMNRMAAELGEAKRKQEVFFQNVSHELRTPLTSIRGNAEGIVYGIMEPERAARVILSESDKLGGLVEDILYLSRAGKGRSGEAAEPIDLREVFSLCVSEQRADADSRGVTFVFDFDEEPVTLSIREQDAERMLGNLISNAIRYARRTVTLRCKNTPKGVYISVSDDGSGISDEDLPHIFERMYKGRGGKHGIGLAIAQSAARSCGGNITAHNSGGAVFEATFPKK